MTYASTLDMTYDEYTYEVDCLLIGETGDPASQEQLQAIARGFNGGVSAWDCFSAITESLAEMRQDARA